MDISICGFHFAFPCNLTNVRYIYMYIYESQVYRKHNYDDCRWRDVTVYESRPETILVRYRDQKERAPLPRSIRAETIPHACMHKRRYDRWVLLHRERSLLCETKPQIAQNDQRSEKF